MARNAGYLYIVGGAFFGGLGVFQSFASMGTLNEVLLWGLVSVIGLFVLTLGVKDIVTNHDERSADPTNALHKTDSRFGRR